MTPIRTLIASRPATLIGDAAGATALVLLFAVALHLPVLI